MEPNAFLIRTEIRHRDLQFHHCSEMKVATASAVLCTLIVANWLLAVHQLSLGAMPGHSLLGRGSSEAGPEAALFWAALEGALPSRARLLPRSRCVQPQAGCECDQRSCLEGSWCSRQRRLTSNC